jgi:hypothetical protein
VWLPPKALVHQWAKHTGMSKNAAKSDLIGRYYEQHPEKDPRAAQN